jgi:dihydrolipoamide dehydrogenase
LKNIVITYYLLSITYQRGGQVMSKKIIIIGGGPGGYVAAIRAAQLGAETTLVERAEIGGVCLNVGCIPTKTLLRTAHEAHALQTGAYAGLLADNVRLDWGELQKHKQNVVNRLKGGVEGLLKANKVKVIRGKAKLLADKSIQIDGKETIRGDVIIIAVGTSPSFPPVPGLDSAGVIDSTGALSLAKIPKSMVIWGVGIVALEFASMYRSAGTEVTVIGRRPIILKECDAQIAEALRKSLQKEGVKFLSKTTITGVKKAEQGLKITAKTGDTEQELVAEKLLVATGRKVNSEGIGLEGLSIKLDGDTLVVDSNFMTNIPNVYAIGDCNGHAMLAHAASAQGVYAVEHAMGHKAYYNKDVVPSCVYTSPEIGAVGLTEEQVKESDIDYYVGHFPLAGNGKSLIEGYTDGFVKLIFEKEYDSLIGAHIIGPGATELIAELGLAMNMEATVDDIISTIHAHPTVNESIMEAALDAKGMAIHWKR